MGHDRHGFSKLSRHTSDSVVETVLRLSVDLSNQPTCIRHDIGVAIPASTTAPKTKGRRTRRHQEHKKPKDAKKRKARRPKEEKEKEQPRLPQGQPRGRREDDRQRQAKERRRRQGDDQGPQKWHIGYGNLARLASNQYCARRQKALNSQNHDTLTG